MITRRKSHIICMLTREHVTGEPESERIILSQAIPREHFTTLYPIYPNLSTVDWPPEDVAFQGLSSAYELVYEVPFTASFETNEETGLTSWSITEFGHVPGKLQLAAWDESQDIETDAPVYAETFDLNSASGWTTGDLEINSYDGSTAPELERKRVYFRWFPAHLRPRCA